MPIGMQLLCNRYEDDKLLNIKDEIGIFSKSANLVVQNLKSFGLQF